MNGLIIIDDEVWVTEVIKNIIDWGKYGFEIIKTYNDGIEALEGIKTYKPSLVMTDIRMPGITGLDIIKEIALLDQDTMSIVISGYNDFEYAQTALTYGAIGYLLKPIDGNELEKIIMKAKGIIEQSEEARVRETSIRKQYEQTVDRLREHLFNNFFDERENHELDIEGINTELKLNFIDENYRIMSIVNCDKEKIDDLFSIVNKKIWELQMPVVCSEIVPIIYHYRIIIIVNYKEEQTIMPILEELLYNLLKKTEYTEITAVVSEEFHDIKRLKREFIKLREVEYARLFLGKGKFYQCKDFSKSENREKGLLMPNTDIMLTQALAHNDLQEGRHIIKEAYEWLTAKVQNNPIAFSRGISRLTEMMKSTMKETNEETKANIKLRERDIEVADSLMEIRKIVLDILGEIFFVNEKADETNEKTTVGLAVDFINKNYMHDITLTDMAQLVHLNANYLSEIFSREVGVTYKEYLTNVRLEAAKELLCKSNLRLTEITAMVGYNDTKHFSKIFKKYIGITPKEYRKLMIG